MRHRSLTPVVASAALLIAACSCPLPTQAGGFNPFYKPTSVEKLATEIDKLERHIDRYGTVVAKHPDVWGESRLTQHRDEYEREMASELSNFKSTLNAQIRTSDQAYLATATLIDAALTSGDSHAANPELSTFIGSVNSAIEVDRSAADTRPDFAKFQINGETTDVVGLEPTILLDQKSRYLNHLHELRRIGEGDDTGDGPGYAIDLVRIPVSVLPGKKTRKGFGAEITLTASSTMGDELLPTTFRRWVLNDLTHQLSIPLTRALNDAELRDRKNELLAVRDGLYQICHPWWSRAWWGGIWSKAMIHDCDEKCYTQESVTATPPTQWLKRSSFETISAYANDSEATETAGVYHVSERSLNLIYQYRPILQDLYCTKTLEKLMKELSRKEYSRSKRTGYVKPTKEDVKPPDNILESIESFVTTASGITNKFIEDLYELTMEAQEITIDAGVSRTKNGELPFPLSQFSTVYGQGLLLHVALEANDRLGEHALNSESEIVHFQDVEAYLIEELNGAYRLLSDSGNEMLWASCTQELAQAVRAQDATLITLLQTEFFSRMSYKAQNSTTGLYAWTIIVEAALLNERLVQDMRETAGTHACPCNPAEWMDFYQPNPSYEARQAFNSYVDCRWPVLTFALDPVTQEQNVGETFSRRREFQLALAVSVATGQLRADQMTRFARRLELDMETIDLNRTIVGFSHGDNNFGWRFFPRVQVPDIDGNLKVAVRDLVFGGPNRDADLKSRRIEPGARECTALVIRPSFIPSLTFDIRSNWFRLTNPGKTVLSMKETVKLSSSIRGMQDAACACVEDEQLYRSGEVYRMLRRVEQLSDELPLQTIYSQVPVENVLGGFRIFAPGATALAPQLYTWYGEPGIDTKNGSALFLVGDNFSVQGTNVIAGNKYIAPTSDAKSPVQLISRRIMRIDTPKDVQTFKKVSPNGKINDYVDIHIATPYGVTQHLAVPVAASVKKNSASGYALNSEGLEIAYCWKNENAKDILIQQSSFPPLKVDRAKDVKSSYLNVKLEFELEGHPKFKPSLVLKLDPKAKNFYPIVNQELIQSFLDYLNASGRFNEQYPPDAVVLRTSKITLTPLTPDLGQPAVKLDKNLTIIFNRHPSCCPTCDTTAKPSTATLQLTSCQSAQPAPAPVPEPTSPASCQDGACVDCKDIPAANWNMKEGMTLAMTPNFDKESKLEKLQLSQGPAEFVIENELPDGFSPVLTQIKLCVTLQNAAGKKLESRFCPSDCVKVKGGKITISKNKLQDWLNMYLVKDLENSWTKDFDAKTMSIKTYLRHIKTRDCTLVVKVDDDLNFKISSKSGDEEAQFWNDLPPAVSQNPEPKTRSTLQLSDRPRFDREAEERRKIFYAPAFQR